MTTVPLEHVTHSARAGHTCSLSHKYHSVGENTGKFLEEDMNIVTIRLNNDESLDIWICSTTFMTTGGKLVPTDLFL